MHFPPTFYRAAAVCSVVSAVTTLMLIFLPELYAPVEGFDGRMARVHEPAYQWRAWAYFIHPFLVLTAATAIAVRLRGVAAGLALLGWLGFVLWGFTEAAQQALTLYAFDKWRLAWPLADEATRAAIRVQTEVYDGLWNAMYFLIVVAFAIGNLLLGLAMLRGRGFTRVIGGFLLAACALTVTIIMGEVGGPTLPGPVGFWLYPLIQPLGRALIGLWLWRAADERALLPGAA